MNGGQDLGGAQGFGPLPLEADEPLFHAPWERRVLALTLAMGATGAWNIDMSRAARESLPPPKYLAASYYEIWFEGLLKLLQSTGLASIGELSACRDGAEPGAEPSAERRPRPEDGNGLPPGLRLLTADRVPEVLSRGSPTARPGPAPLHAVGDRVHARLMNPIGHTRLPRYVRGRSGLVERCHGAHIFPDRHATDRDEAPQVLYTVRFDARDLWGPDTTADAVCVDLWESYLVADDAGRAGPSG